MKQKDVYPYDYMDSFNRFSEKIKALLGMLARLSWGRINMICSMDGRQGRVHLEHVKGLTNKFADDLHNGS